MSKDEASLSKCVIVRLTDEPVTSSDDDSYDDFEENLPRAVVAAVEECFSDAQSKGHADQADILIFAATEAEIRETTRGA